MQKHKMTIFCFTNNKKEQYKLHNIYAVKNLSTILTSMSSLFNIGKNSLHHNKCNMYVLPLSKLHQVNEEDYLKNSISDDIFFTNNWYSKSLLV